MCGRKLAVSQQVERVAPLQAINKNLIEFQR